MYWETQRGSSQPAQTAAPMDAGLKRYWDYIREHHKANAGVEYVIADDGDVPSTVPNSPAKFRRLRRFKINDDCNIHYVASESIFRIGGNGIKEIDETQKMAINK